MERATLRQGFDPARKTYVTTDASDEGIGGVLSQADEQGEEVVIAFYSKSLDKAQRNYAANEREALACMLTIEHWEPLLLGRHFTLRTDHQALETMLKNPKTRRESSKFPRWLQRLQEFDYDIQYLPGLENKLPDYLSRLRERADSLQVKAITQGALRDAYKQDPFAEEQVVTVRQGAWGPWKKGNPLSRIFYGLRQQLHTSPEGFVMKGRRIWVPGTALRRQILREAHEGHTGIVGTKATIRRTYWWTGMGREVEEWVGRCQGCQRSSKSKPVGDKRQASSIPRPITPGAPVQGGSDGTMCGWEPLPRSHRLRYRLPIRLEEEDICSTGHHSVPEGEMGPVRFPEGLVSDQWAAVYRQDLPGLPTRARCSPLQGSSLQSHRERARGKMEPVSQERVADASYSSRLGSRSGRPCESIQEHT